MSSSGRWTGSFSRSEEVIEDAPLADEALEKKPKTPDGFAPVDDACSDSVGDVGCEETEFLLLQLKMVLSIFVGNSMFFCCLFCRRLEVAKIGIEEVLKLTCRTSPKRDNCRENGTPKLDRSIK